MCLTDKETIIEKLRALPDERTRAYEKGITAYANQWNNPEGICMLLELMNAGLDISYEAFYCLETIYRRNRDYSKLEELIKNEEKIEGFKTRVSFKHICIMYNVHSETLFDYDDMLMMAHESACEMMDNSGYQHTFANTFATICEKCLPEDAGILIEKWYETALYCVERAIFLDRDYAKFYSTKARIVALKNRYEEANDLLLKAIDLEKSDKKDYPLLIGNYQYYRAMIAIKKQNVMVESRLPVNKSETLKTLPELKTFNSYGEFAFISYSHRDIEKVVPIINDLSKEGYNIWYDHELSGGQDWTDEIAKHIVECKVFVLMVSTYALMSGNVRNEILMAQNYGKIVVPVFIENVYLSPGAELQLQKYHRIFQYNLSREIFNNQLFDALAQSGLEKHFKASNPLRNVHEKEADRKREQTYSYHIVEEFSVSKSGKEEKNEDLIYIDENFCAVFDGATSKNNCTWNGKSAGKITVELIAECMKSDIFERTIDGRTAIALLQAKLKEFEEKHQVEGQGIHLCASGVIYSRARHEIWTVGDCQYAINGKVTAPEKRVDNLLSEVRSLAIRCLLLEGKSEKDILENDESRALILNILKKQHFLENSLDEYGFGVFNGNGMIREINIIKVNPGDEIILASDGYPILQGTLEKSEEKLKELLRTDPLCYKEYKSTKGLVQGNISFDDRSYLRFITD